MEAIAFLQAHGLLKAGETAEWVPLEGGVSSEIWRVRIGERSLCVKRALPTLKVRDVWKAPVSRNAFEWGIGVDYTWEGYLLLLQVNQTDILNNSDTDLLVKNIDTVLVGNLRKDFWHDTLTAQVVAIQALESSYTLLMPRITYRFWDRFEARAGYLFIAGRQNSLVGQYKNNDEAFFWLRYLI